MTGANTNIGSVAIIGGGVEAWMTAAFLATMLGKAVSISVVDTGPSKQPTTPASLPPLKVFHAQLGIDESDLLAKTQATLKLGTQFVNWGSLGNRYFSPHGSYGADFDVVSLHQWWLKAHNEDADTPNLDALSFAWGLAQENRFTLPTADRRLIQATFDFAYHLDLDLYCDYLMALAKARGVTQVERNVSNVALNAETGEVEGVALDTGSTVTADLYIDCTGQDATLIGEALKAPFEDWSAALPCNTAVSVTCERGGEFTPYTRITQREAGWQWRTPLQHLTSTGYIYAKDHLSDDDALGSLMDNLDARTLSDPIISTFTNGRRTTPWLKNVVAIGGAAGFLEPLASTSLHMVQVGLTRLLALWPQKGADPAVASIYNDMMAHEWETPRDLLVLHYMTSSRTDTPLWRACKAIEAPQTLTSRIAHWQTYGRLTSTRPEVFQPAAWLAVLVGQGGAPKMWDPLADARSDGVDYKARLAGIARIIAETAAQMPLHRDWIEKNCRGRKP